jgi:hypothetical protein
MNPENHVISCTVSPMKRIFDSFMPGEDFSYISGMKNEPLSFSLAYRSTAQKGENGRAPDTPISVRVISSLPVSAYKVCKVAYAASECEDGGAGAVGCTAGRCACSGIYQHIQTYGHSGKADAQAWRGILPLAWH